MDGFFGGNRQTTLRMDRHETIVTPLKPFIEYSSANEGARINKNRSS